MAKLLTKYVQIKYAETATAICVNDTNTRYSDSYIPSRYILAVNLITIATANINKPNSQKVHLLFFTLNFEI